MGIGRCGCVCGGECMLVNLSRRSVLVRVQAREHSHLPDALHVLQYRREGACANYPRRARPPRIWVRFPSPKLGQKFLDFLQNKLSKSDFLTGRKNSILIPTRNADGMWASIMSLQETWFLWDTQLRQLWKAARGPHATEILASHVHHQTTHVLEPAH